MTNKNLQDTLRELSKADYDRMVAPSELLTKECGNSYCGSLYAGLLSLVANKADELKDKRVMMFSYGSGLAATLFSIKVREDVRSIRDKADIHNRLARRTRVTPQEFTRMLDYREQTYTKFDYKPQAPVSSLLKGTFYLDNVDKLERRFYGRAFHTLAASAIRVARFIR